MNSSCPSPEELARIGSSANAGSCPPGIATHIQSCPDCQDFLKRSVDRGLGSTSGSMAELPGADTIPRIDGFTIERELGRGAMGVVYLASREAPRRDVALKLLPGGRRASARERQHWLREAEAASRVRHPNVVTLYEVAETDDWFLLVLEYIPGGTLADRLAEPLAPDDAAALMATIARAVRYIHLSGQLHLDLKPSNVLLDGDCSAGWSAVIPKVSDFGIARAVGPGATATGQTGPGRTPAYMAPEQITKARGELTPRADIHALGAILYHMLTGRPPFRGATDLETIALVRNHDPIPPRRFIPRIPADLETICLKCLQKEPGQRYPSAEALAEDLDRFLAGHSVTVRPVFSLEKSWRWCRRRPVVAALMATLALTLSAGFVVIVVLSAMLIAAQARSERAEGVVADMAFEGMTPSVLDHNTVPRINLYAMSVELLQRIRACLINLRRADPAISIAKLDSRSSIVP